MGVEVASRCWSLLCISEFVLRVTSSLVLKIICGVSGFGIGYCSAQCDVMSSLLSDSSS